MFGYIATYLAGIFTGAALIYANKRSVQTALANQRKRHEADMQRMIRENANLRQEIDSMTRSHDCADAYRRGKRDGRNDPATNAERFAKTFEGRQGSVQFRDCSRSA